MEEWRDIVGYEGLYQVSNYGRVRSLSRKVKFGWSYRTIPSMILKPCIRSRINSLFEKGYYVVGLHNNGEAKYKYIHRLVAEAFIPNLENKPQIDHIDGDTANNRVENLRWCTSKENNNFEIHKLRASISQKLSYKRRKYEN